MRRLLGLNRLTECIGSRFTLGAAVAIPLPHPSGASGWLNDTANRRRLEAALGLVRKELGRLDSAEGFVLVPLKLVSPRPPGGSAAAAGPQMRGWVR